MVLNTPLHLFFPPNTPLLFWPAIILGPLSFCYLHTHSWRMQVLISIPNGSSPLLIFLNVTKDPSALPHLEWQLPFINFYWAIYGLISHVRFGILTWGKTSLIDLILVEYSQTYREKIMQRVTLYLIRVWDNLSVYQIMDWIIIRCRMQSEHKAVRKTMMKFDSSGMEKSWFSTSA